ncbi:MAG: GNAT family N-acetyltransferase, partial [Proteobacteria bacterium]
MKVDEKDKLAWIYFIVIHDAFQRKGYGKKAMQLLKEEAKVLGASALWLNVSAENGAA